MYLKKLEQQNGINSGLLGDPTQLAQTLGQYAQQAQQRVGQVGRQHEAEMQQAAAMSEQAERQRQAEEARKRQQIMQIGMMIAGGALGGGGEAAAEGGAGQAATEKMAEEAAENAMAEIAPGEFLKSQVANPESFLYDPLKAYQNGGAFFTPKSGLLWG